MNVRLSDKYLRPELRTNAYYTPDVDRAFPFDSFNTHDVAMHELGHETLATLKPWTTIFFTPVEVEEPPKDTTAEVTRLFEAVTNAAPTPAIRSEDDGWLLIGGVRVPVNKAPACGYQISGFFAR